MKSYSATRRRDAAEVSRCGVVAVARCRAAALEIAGAAALALMFAVATAGPSWAQDAGTDGSSWKRGSSWERVDSVLVLPPVFSPDAESAPTDACAQDCPATSVQGDDESARAVVGTADDLANPHAGTADNPTDESVAVGGIALDGSGSQEQQHAAAISGDPQNAGDLDDSPGSAQHHRAQRAATEIGGYGIAQAPPMIVAAPIGPYRLPYRAPRTFAPAPPVFAPAWSPPTSPAWMPPPMVRMGPLPPMVGHGFSPTAGGFPGAFYGSSGKLSQPVVPGFRAGFGR